MIVVFNWAGCKEFDELPYEHNEKRPDGELYDIVKIIFDKGLEVMLSKGTGDYIYVFVDNKRFRQR